MIGFSRVTDVLSRHLTANGPRTYTNWIGGCFFVAASAFVGNAAFAIDTEELFESLCLPIGSRECVADYTETLCEADSTWTHKDITDDPFTCTLAASRELNRQLVQCTQNGNTSEMSPDYLVPDRTHAGYFISAFFRQGSGRVRFAIFAADFSSPFDSIEIWVEEFGTDNLAIDGYKVTPPQFTKLDEVESHDFWRRLSNGDRMEFTYIVDGTSNSASIDLDAVRDFLSLTIDALQDCGADVNIQH